MIEKIEEEEGLEFKTVRIFIGDHEHFNPQDIVKEGLYKIVNKIDNVNRTYYYKDRIETSKERILHEDRIKKLRR
jgi:hypothetical protein